MFLGKHRNLCFHQKICGHILEDLFELITYKSELFQVQELKTKMKSSGMPWPGDEGEQRWEQAWMAIKKVECFACMEEEYKFGHHT